MVLVVEVRSVGIGCPAYTMGDRRPWLRAHASDALLNVEEGSLYPALHRMEQSGWIRSEWALTETGRKAKYYKLTAVGRKQLEEAEKSFEQLVKGVRAMFRYA